MTSANIAFDIKQSQNHLEAIRSTLRTQVSDILRVNITQLSTQTPDQVYDTILNTPELLHECFQFFRTQPELFSRVMIGQNKRPITSDEEALWCGRSVADVVKLIVRASAKRHFRATLPPAPPLEIIRAPQLTTLGMAAVRFGLKKAPPSPLPQPLPQGPAEMLYGAFRENLRFEWQIPLIPHYAPIELPTITQLGSRILTFREPDQLKILAAEGLTPEGRLPLLLDTAARLRGPDGGVDSRALAEAFEKLDLSTIFPDLAENGARRAVALIATMEARIFQMLQPALDNNLKLTTIFLFSALSRMGEKAFRQGLGPTGALWAIQKLAKHLETCKPWPRNLTSMKQASERAMAFAIDLDSGLPAQNPVKTAPTPKPVAKAPAAKMATTPPVPSGPARASRSPVSAASPR